MLLSSRFHPRIAVNQLWHFVTAEFWVDHGWTVVDSNMIYWSEDYSQSKECTKRWLGVATFVGCEKDECPMTGQWPGNDQEISLDLYETSNSNRDILLDLNFKNKIESLLWSKFQVWAVV